MAVRTDPETGIIIAQLVQTIAEERARLVPLKKARESADHDVRSLECRLSNLEIELRKAMDVFVPPPRPGVSV